MATVLFARRAFAIVIAPSTRRFDGRCVSSCSPTNPGEEETTVETASSKPSDGQFFSRQTPVGFAVFVAGLAHDLFRQGRRGWLLVPRQRLEIVAKELLVEAGLTPARLVLVG